MIRFESVIHEFDPYFNYRTTQYLVEEGFFNFHNWFDDRAWYPLGRIVGGTIYPGLMVTSTFIYKFLHFLHVSIDVRNVCVFLAPLFSAFTTLVTYLLTKELKVRHPQEKAAQSSATKTRIAQRARQCVRETERERDRERQRQRQRQRDRETETERCIHTHDTAHMQKIHNTHAPNRFLGGLFACFVSCRRTHHHFPSLSASVCLSASLFLSLSRLCLVSVSSLSLSLVCLFVCLPMGYVFCFLIQERARWACGGMHGRHCAWLHFPLCCWLVRQRRHRHLLHAQHVLPVGQGCQDGLTRLVLGCRPRLFLHGKLVLLLFVLSLLSCCLCCDDHP